MPAMTLAAPPQIRQISTSMLNTRLSLCAQVMAIWEGDFFELFDLSVDPGETQNLAEREAEKFNRLLELWREERQRLGIILPEDL